MLHARDLFYFPNAFLGKAASGVFLNLLCMLCHRFINRLPEPLNHRGNHAGIQKEPSFMRETITRGLMTSSVVLGSTSGPESVIQTWHASHTFILLPNSTKCPRYEEAVQVAACKRHQVRHGNSDMPAVRSQSIRLSTPYGIRGFSWPVYSCQSV